MPRRLLLLATLLTAAFLTAGLVVTQILGVNMQPTTSHPPHVVLVGASIGQGWNLSEWPVRTQVRGVTTEAIAAWQFDKSSAIDELLQRPSRPFHLSRSYLRSLFQPPPKPPTVVILKECSSYFPGDSAQYQHSVRTWVQRLRSRGIAVVLATVAPVTEQRAKRDPRKLEALVDFNHWLRTYATEQGLTVLDLEAALKTDSGFALRDEFAISDGSHLNSSAYSVLDRLLKQTLCDSALAVTCDASPIASTR